MWKDTDIIRNLDDLLAHVEADNVQHLEKRIYKGTVCGAWIDTNRKIPGPARKQLWVFHLRKYLGGVRLFGARQVGHKRVYGKGMWNLSALPREALDYLGIQDDKPRVDITVQGLDELVVDPSRATKRITRKSGGCSVYTTVELHVHLPDKPGIAVGSIVEGVDDGTDTHELAYPFTGKQFWEALEAVEREAQEIWDDTHGCPKCGFGESERGMPMVNPECKACKGQGIII